MARNGAMRGALWSYEQSLRRTATRRGTECADRDLAALLRHIGERRRVRAAHLGTPPGGDTSPETRTRPALAGAGTILHSEAVGERIRILRVARPPGFTFRAGQYAKVGLDDGRRNDYSIASPPHEEHLELCIESIASGRLSPRLAGLAAGDRVSISERAKGSFLLDEGADLHVMVATTTGIAPLRSMLLDALQRTRRARFAVLHGASYADELPYRQELEELAAQQPSRLTYVPTVSRPGEARNAGWEGRTGRVDALAADLHRRGSFASSAPRVYACGNSGMIAAVKDYFDRAGVPVRSEAFD